MTVALCGTTNAIEYSRLCPRWPVRAVRMERGCGAAIEQFPQYSTTGSAIFRANIDPLDR
jgi:hypothetical protein